MLKLIRKIFRLKSDPQPWENRPLVPGIAPTYGLPEGYGKKVVRQRVRKHRPVLREGKRLGGMSPKPASLHPRPVPPPPPPGRPARRVDSLISQKKRDDNDDIDPFLSAAVDIGAALAVDALLDSFSSDSSSSSDSSFGSDSGSSDWSGGGGDSGGAGADGGW